MCEVTDTTIKCWGNAILCLGELQCWCGGIEDLFHLCGGNDIIPVGEMTTIH